MKLGKKKFSFGGKAPNAVADSEVFHSKHAVLDVLTITQDWCEITLPLRRRPYKRYVGDSSLSQKIVFYEFKTR